MAPLKESIILAGGRGTRLSSVVPDLPKPMAPVCGKPFLDYLLQRLAAQGIERVCLSVGYLAHKIQDFYGDSFHGMALVYSVEDSPLGTGGAIRAALNYTSSDDVLILNGDTIAEIDLQAMAAVHKASESVITMALIRVPNTERYGAVQVNEGTVAGFLEKGTIGPGLINAGCYLIKRSIFDPFQLPASFSFEQEILTRQLVRLKPAAFLSNGYFIDIGIPEDYQRAQVELCDPTPK